MGERYREFRRDELAQEQQAVFDAIAAPRGGVVPAPFHVLLESPDLASLTQALGAFCRYRTGFAPHLSELAVLITAAHWRADYDLAVHTREARKAGVEERAIAALLAGETPDDRTQLLQVLQQQVGRFGQLDRGGGVQDIARGET